jgi:Zn-dependent protease with chaperone function
MHWSTLFLPRLTGNAGDRHTRHRPSPRGGQSATASLYIVDPLARHGVATLFAPHPPLAERVRRLRALGGVQALPLAPDP